MAKQSTPKKQDGAKLDIGAAELMAAISCMSDFTPAGPTYQTWKVALVAERLASNAAPDLRRDVFYAGLLQNMDAVAACKPVTCCANIKDQVESVYIRSNPERGASLLELLPEMTAAAQYVRFHHEWWNGGGYPGVRQGDDIPLGSQMLRAADELVAGGCFAEGANVVDKLRSFAPLTGRVWSKEMWEALVRSLSDLDFRTAVGDTCRMAEAISAAMNENALPAATCSETSIEKILHIFAALTDVASPAKEGHSLRTARLARAVAEKMGLGEDDVRNSYRAGLVHDCGWVAVPRGIAERSGKFSSTELEAARSHAFGTAQILGCLPDRSGMAALGQIASRHHERLDGRGYPHRLTAKDLHPVTRILSVADAFDAMVSVVTYRVLSVKGAITRLEECAGTQFDGDAVKALTDLVQERDLPQDLPVAA